MSPALRQALLAADGLLRQGDARAARTALESFAVTDGAGQEAAEFQFLLAQACFQDGDPDTARALVERALARQPQWAEAHQLLGLACADLECLEDAAVSLERALALRPDNARTCANLGAVYRRRTMLPEAIAMYRQATALNPTYVQAWRGLAETLQAAEQIEAALAAWRHWSGLLPDKAEAYSGLGWALSRAGRWDEAESVLTQAIAHEREDFHADALLAYVRRERGDIEGALAAYRQGHARAPAALTPRFGAALALPQIYADREDLRRWRARYAEGMAELRADLPRLLDAPAALWDLDWSNFYLGYQGEDDLGLQREYADLISRLARAAAPDWTAAPEPAARAGRRLRVGFASSFFRRCTVGAYFASWLTGLDRRRFEVLAFHFGSEIDAGTLDLRARVDGFLQLSGGVREIAQKIRAARLDVLIYPQLGMDGRDATLAALRLAPVQCAAWGHPVTTGSAAIDYFFSCGEMESAESAGHYSEQLLLLPGLGTAYARPAVRVATRAEFGLPDGIPLYACPQSLFKIHPDNDAVFADLLAGDSRGHLVFCAEPGLPATLQFMERIRRALDRQGIDVARRVHWQPLRPQSEFRAMLSVCDVMLDSLHWTGGNTSLDALAAGLPIVTQLGRFLRGRQSAAMLRIIGLPQLVTADAAAAVRVALDIANAPDAAIRAQIADGCPLLFDRPEPLRALEEHLLRIAGWDA
ncbi:MAG: tetratricopeptide repeat protein [Betaproteobacteria bacterium]|nr:tetratricopeptide repeat protein [Betaproteobacteria bacterium]